MKKGNRTPGGVSVEVKGKNLQITPALHDQVVGKMSKLDRYLDQLNVIDVELCTEKTRESAHHNLVEATAHVRGRTIRVQTSDADMYAAIDGAVDKLYRQLNRTKERMKDHSGDRAMRGLPSDEMPEIGGDGDSEAQETTLHVEKVDLEPMFEDEALDELAASSRDFYLFLNASSETINVLYRRPDGGVTLVEPRRR